MNASAVIAAIEQLSPQERAKVLSYIRQLEGSSLQDASIPATSAEDPAFRAAADKVFTEHRQLFKLLAQ